MPDYLNFVLNIYYLLVLWPTQISDVTASFFTKLGDPIRSFKDIEALHQVKFKVARQA